MYYQFPNLDSFKLAITSGQVPQETVMASVKAAIDPDGNVWVDQNEDLPKKVTNALKKLGVQEHDKIKGQALAQAVCWLGVLPVTKTEVHVENTTVVLFELTDSKDLPPLVGEMLRLGNDRQSFRWLKSNGEDRVILKVGGPPYYSLLRTFEPKSSVRGYTERAARVWVEVGYTHPLIQYIKVDPKKILLVNSENQWQILDEGEYQDIYKITDLILPNNLSKWKEVEVKNKSIKVPMTLVPGTDSNPAELWVLRQNAMAQVDAFVRDSDDKLIERLSFAVSQSKGGTPHVVLMLRPSKQAVPVLVFHGESYQPHHMKLPNLFLPTAHRLRPPLRRDAVRTLLANDSDRVVWLAKQEDGSFIPESLPHNSFRPLQNWVDYVLEHDHVEVEEWVSSSNFSFEQYSCSEDYKPEDRKAAKPPKDKKKGPRLRNEDTDFEEVQSKHVVKVKKKEDDEGFVLAQEKPNELKIRLKELESQFLAFTGPLDEPERQALWPMMAAVHASLKNKEDASVCWLNSIWEDYDNIHDSTISRWAVSEGVSNLTAAILDNWIGNNDPLPGDLRQLVVAIIDSVVLQKKESQKLITARISQIQQYLEKKDSRLSVRAAWLAWICLAKLGGNDVLTLARARDRVLERLLNHGLSPEYDLPTFLRFAGAQSGERFRAVQDRVVGLYDRATTWINMCNKSGGCDATLTYKNLMFAFGFARLGETDKARRLQKEANDSMGKKDAVHQFLVDGFCYRINQALEGKAHIGALPAELLTKHKNFENKFELFKIDRLRDKSRILEPQEKIDAYRGWRANQDDLSKNIATILANPDKATVGKNITKLLHEQKKTKDQQKVLQAALEVGPHIGEEFSVNMIKSLIGMKEQLASPSDQHEIESRAKMLERSLFLAAHYDRGEHLQLLVGMFTQLLETKGGNNDTTHELNSLASQCLRGLRKLGLREEIDMLLTKMTNIVTGGQTLDQLRAKRTTNWHSTLITLLQIASGWLYFGKVDQAIPVLDETRRLLLKEEDVPEDSRISQPVYRTDLVCAYASTLGQAPVETALQRLEELFNRLPRVADTFTTNSHYSLFQLRVIESVVMAVVNDDFAAGQDLRRWMDEDEFLIRRRIHSDIRRSLKETGV